jgi:tRNA nucleotidyltransferase (CCA-adding enzyme)
MLGREADLQGQAAPGLLTMNDDLAAVIKLLAQAGAGVWIVGGAVRDALLGIPSSEVDLAVDIPPQEVLKIFPDAIATGIKYGTVTIRSGNSFFETTTTRTEAEYSDGRRPEIVEWGTSLANDLSRRDLTINAMAWDPLREILYDPYQGAFDIEDKTLRAVGDANSRLSEDGLRIMRVYRFMDRGFEGPWLPERKLSSALINCLHMLEKVSTERIWSEFQRIIIGRNASEVLTRMNLDGALKAIFGKVIHIDERISKCSKHLPSRMTILFTYITTEEVKKIMANLKTSAVIRAKTIRLHHLRNEIPSAKEVTLYREVMGDDALAHLEVLSLLHPDVDLLEIKKQVQQIKPGIKPLATGDWLMNTTGIAPGMRLGHLKEWLHRIQIERSFTELSQVETVLCTLPWQDGDSRVWPKLRWPSNTSY